MAYRRDIADTDYALGALMGAGQPSPTEGTGQNRTGSRKRQLAPYNSAAATSPAISTTGTSTTPTTTSSTTGTSTTPTTPPTTSTSATSSTTTSSTSTSTTSNNNNGTSITTSTTPKTKSSSKPKRPAKAGNDYSRSRLPGSRQKATAPPPPTDGAPDLIAHRVEMGVEQPDLHRRTGMSRLRIDAKANLAQRVQNACRRSKVMSQALSVPDVFYSGVSLALEERLLAMEVATVLEIRPDLPALLDAVPVIGTTRQVALQRLHAAVYADLLPVSQAITRRAAVVYKQRREALQRDCERDAALAMALDEAARNPRPRQNNAGHPVKPAVRPEQLYAQVPADAHLRPVDRLIARKAPGLLSPRLSPEELAEQYPLSGWRDHGERDRQRNRTEPPTNLSTHLRALASLDPADPSATEVVTAYLCSAFHHDPERDVPGFKAALRGLFIAWCWSRPEYGEHKTARARIDAITADWSSALAKPADRSDMARWHAYRSVLVHAAGAAATDQMMTASTQRTDQMRAWFVRYAPQNAPALRQLLAMIGMLDEARDCRTTWTTVPLTVRWQSP